MGLCEKKWIRIHFKVLHTKSGNATLQIIGPAGLPKLARNEFFKTIFRRKGAKLSHSVPSFDYPKPRTVGHGITSPAQSMYW